VNDVMMMMMMMMMKLKQKSVEQSQVRESSPLFPCTLLGSGYAIEMDKRR